MNRLACGTGKLVANILLKVPLKSEFKKQILSFDELNYL